MTPWELPMTAQIGGRVYELHTDYRDVLEVIKHLNNPDNPEYLRWRIAIAVFFEGEIPQEDQQAAMEYLASFISCGESDRGKHGPILLDWDQDAKAIIADVNKVAGKEIRAEPYLHWWTFLAYFQAIGEGQLSTIVSIRDKLARGKKLDGWEKDFYRDNRSMVDLKKRYSAEELAEQERIKKILGE